jgi:Ca-activated chloride channel family protein
MIRAFGVMLLVVALAAAQAGEQVIAVDVDLVNIYFTVCNKKGRLIPDLSRESFTIFEDGEREVITNFSRETDLPLTLVLLFDTSGSVRFKLAFEQEAAIDFLNSTLRPGRDKVAVFTFDSSVDLRQDYTSDLQLLANAVKSTRSGGGTRLYDALQVILDGSLTAQKERRGIILLTDGDDNSSRSTPKQVIQAAQRNNVAIYTISVNSLDATPGDFSRHDQILEMFAEETGGQSFFPRQPKDLFASFKMINKELRSLYTIAYRSTNPNKDGAFRTIRIEAKDSRYLVHSRSGYYAPTAAIAQGK